MYLKGLKHYGMNEESRTTQKQWPKTPLIKIMLEQLSRSQYGSHRTP